MNNQIKKNFQMVKGNIKTIAENCNRDPDEIKLVVVTKAQPVDKIKEVIEAGADILGENYPEESEDKIVALQQYQHIQWHMIGHLQSRKIPIVINSFSLIQSLDNKNLAEKINKKILEVHKKMPVFIEINISGEESKKGFPGWHESEWAFLEVEINQLNALPGLEVCGLMTMPPFYEDIEKTRPYFSKLRKLRDKISVGQGLSKNISKLSIGTSVDYKIAIEEGATYVRVGRAIMGERAY